MSCDQLVPSGRCADWTQCEDGSAAGEQVESNYVPRIHAWSSGAENRIAATIVALTQVERRHASYIESRYTVKQVLVLCRIFGVPQKVTKKVYVRKRKAELCCELAQYLNEFQSTFCFDTYLHGCLQRAVASPMIRRRR